MDHQTRTRSIKPWLADDTCLMFFSCVLQLPISFRPRMRARSPIRPESASGDITERPGVDRPGTSCDRLRRRATRKKKKQCDFRRRPWPLANHDARPPPRNPRQAKAHSKRGPELCQTVWLAVACSRGPIPRTGHWTGAASQARRVCQNKKLNIHHVCTYMHSGRAGRRLRRRLSSLSHRP